MYVLKYSILLLSLFVLTSCGMRSSQAPSVPALSGETQMSSSGDPYKIGSVDTVFKLIGPDHKIEV